MALPPPICKTNSCYPSILAASLAALLWVAPLTASATVLQFTLNTSPLSGTNASLAFDFLNYDPASNSVIISDFFTDGILGGASTAGDVTGTLIPGPVTLADTNFFNEFLQAITLGNTLSFTLTLSQQVPSTSPLDSFSFFLLDDLAFFPLFETTAPIGTGALFQVDIDGSPTSALQVFASANPALAVTWIVGPPATSIPLPSTALLIGAGLLGGFAARRWRVELQ
ncbi:MAG TPA: NF038129 family PEP-CTERM protein [Candidatus Competibacteraceae bacterium]|nr:NF038129 family PEP-CTERM protein [Gammaproteobacteria bacterium]HRY14856.1 NF038129 family PEP-CTERM protein [Candidatus Competibacteraceae bacterium]